MAEAAARPGARPATLVLTALAGVPAIADGADLAAVAVEAAAASGVRPESGDVLVVAQKIVSKAEGRTAFLDDAKPGARARELAAAAGKDPRLVELILSESQSVLRCRPGLLIVVHRTGAILANAGIDASNVAGGAVLLWPRDPDASASALRGALRRRLGVDIGVIVSDSVGRPWRLGTVGLAIGVAGLPGLVDLRGRPDLYGRPLQVSETALADELASAASLVMGEGAEGRPMALARGAPYARRNGSAAELLRPAGQDLFR